MFFSKADKYDKLSDADIEREGLKRKIAGGLTNGSLDRQYVINALLQRDQYKDNVITLWVACLALIVSIIALFK